MRIAVNGPDGRYLVHLPIRDVSVPSADFEARWAEARQVLGLKGGDRVSF